MQSRREVQPGRLGRPCGARSRAPRNGLVGRRLAICCCCSPSPRSPRRGRRGPSARISGPSSYPAAITQICLADRDRLQRGDSELRDRPGGVGGHLVLHLHRLDDADHLARRDLVALGDLHVQHGSLHRADDGAAAPARTAPATGHAFGERARGTAARARAPSPSRAARRPPPRSPRSIVAPPAAEPAPTQLRRPAPRPAPPAQATRRRRGMSRRRGSTDATAAPCGSRSASSRRRSGTRRGRAASVPDRVLPVGAAHDQLRDHRVVERRDDRAPATPESTRTPGPGRLAVGGDRPGRRQEAVRGILGVDPAPIACPLERICSCVNSSGSPRAICICARTRSMPVTSSVTVCSTWMRVFISMK